MVRKKAQSKPKEVWDTHLYLETDFRDWLEAQAKLNERSLTAEIRYRLRAGTPFRLVDA